MFFIVNITKGPVTLEDIKISLGPHQAIDLDKVMNRSESDKSKHLKNAVAKGHIKIKRKDVETKESQIIVKKENVGNIKDELMNEIKQGMSDISKTLLNQINYQKEGISTNDLDKMTEKILEKIQEGGQTIIIQKGEEKNNEEEDVKIDEKTLTDIHKRAVNKLTEKSKTGSISYQEESVNDDLDDNISELEGLL